MFSKKFQKGMQTLLGTSLEAIFIVSFSTLFAFYSYLKSLWKASLKDGEQVNLVEEILR